ncbi:MAG: carboxypeptidase regulatory-like domain-containing protein [candidate division Zixibacteria bacterium]|nr:carboxypeptidase regulatory-like domain-containing protein [candidate division Zixibacteria bacterium]
MIECSKCGSANQFDGAVFCKNCGERLGQAVAVDVAERPQDALTQEAADQPKPSQQPEAEADFTVEDVADPEAATPPADRPAGDGTGIDKLLSLYGNESKVEAAKSLDDPESGERTSLGIESASDFLMRTQTDSAPEPQEPEAQEPKRQPSAVTKTPGEIMSRLKPLKDDDELPTPPPAEGVSEIDKGRLLDSLSKTLRSDAAPESESSAASVPEAAATAPVRATRDDAVADAEAAAETDDNVVADSQAIAIAVPEPALPNHRQPAVFLRGQSLTVPKPTLLRPGDQVTIAGQEFVVKAGSIDRRKWIIGGAAALLVIALVAMKLFSTPAVPKATVFGVVTNSESDEVLAGISVSIPQLNLMTVTDEHGVFKFTGLANGRYDVKMDGELFEERYFPLVVQNNQSDIMYGSVTPILPQTRRSQTTAQPVATTPIQPDDQPEYGGLKINCNVADAGIYLDGKLAGKAGQSLKRIRPGNRALEVRAEGYVSYVQPIVIAEGETQELVVTLEDARPTAPAEYTAQDFFTQAETLFGEQQYVEAVGYYTLALAKDNTMVKAYLRRAEAHLAAGKKLNARADYRSAADLYLNAGQYAQAIGCYDKIIAFQPDAADAYTLRGWARIASGNYDGGAADLEKSLSFSPEDKQAQIDVGKAYYMVGRYKDAEKVLKKLKKFGDESPEIYGYLALSHLAMGNEGEARKTYEQFRKAASSSVVARMSTESGWQRLTALAGN